MADEQEKPLSGVQVDRVEARVVEADTLRVKNIAIVNEAGRQVATLASVGVGAGLWLTGAKGEMVAIYALEGQTAIGLYDNIQNASGGLDIALFISNGEPTIQFRQNGGNPKSVSLQDIFDVVSKKEGEQ